MTVVNYSDCLLGRYEKSKQLETGNSSSFLIANPAASLNSLGRKIVKSRSESGSTSSSKLLDEMLASNPDEPEIVHKNPLYGKQLPKHTVQVQKKLTVA
jgi:hypothetical protein